MDSTKSACATIWTFVISTISLLHREKSCHVFCANYRKKANKGPTRAGCFRNWAVLRDSCRKTSQPKVAAGPRNQPNEKRPSQGTPGFKSALASYEFRARVKSRLDPYVASCSNQLKSEIN